MEELKMRPGETMCYYRARGGERSVYVTIVYEKDTLRGSIIQRQEVKKERLTTDSSNALEQENYML